MAIISTMIERHQWFLPEIAGVPALEHGPLYYWVATVFVRFLAHLGVAAHDAARLSTGLWMALAFWGCGLSARAIYGRGYGRVAVVVLLGCLGLLQWGHHIAPAVLVLVGFSWLAYGLVLAGRRPLHAGVVLAGSWAVLGLGASYAELLLAVLLSLALVWSASKRRVMLLTCTTSLLLAAPLIALWPVALWLNYPALYGVWWQKSMLGAYGGLLEPELWHAFGFLPGIVLWFAWPALPLAAWTCWLNRAVLWHQALWRNQLLVLLIVVIYVALAGMPSEEQALLLLVSLSLLAAGGVDDLRRGAAQALNWFGIVTSGSIILLLWVLWIGNTSPILAGIHVYLRRYGGLVNPAFGLGACFALLLAGFWVMVLLRKNPLGRRAVTNWACGIALGWGVFVGLWQTWLDDGKSYQGVASAIATRVSSGCLDVGAVAEAPRAALDYFTKIELVASRDSGEQCVYRLLPWPVSAADAVLVWEGGRPQESRERFYLYRVAR